MGSFEERLEFLPRVTLDASKELVIDIEFDGVHIGQRILQITNIEFDAVDINRVNFVISDPKNPKKYIEIREPKQ